MGQSSKLLGAIVFLAVSALTACGGASSTAASLAGWRTIADIPLPGGASRLDYQSLDALHHRLDVAHSALER